MKKYCLYLTSLIVMMSLFVIDVKAMRRRTLNLDNQGITSLRDPALTERLRPGIRRVLLAGNQITSFDGIEDFPETVEEVDLFANQVSDFTALANAPSSLKKIILSSNNIQNVASFPIMPNLEELRLNNNNLESINGAGFLNSENIKSLDLGDNSIFSISTTILPRTLESLTLSNNPLLFPPRDFRDFSNLHTLDMSNTLLTSKSLFFPRTLKRLILDSNGLQDFDLVFTYDFPDGLCELSLANNIIFGDRVNEAFINLESLRVLNLENNEREDFAASLPQSLRRLFLSGNNLASLEQSIRRLYRRTNRRTRVLFRAQRNLPQRAARRVQNFCN